MLRWDKIGTKKIGTMMMESGMITPEQLQEALVRQKMSKGKRLGQIMLEAGYITEEMLLSFLARQFNTEFISLKEYGEITHEATDIIPEKIAREQNIIPIRKSGRQLTIATFDLPNAIFMENLQIKTNTDIQIVFATERDVRHAIDAGYGSGVKSAIKDALDQIKARNEDEDAENVEIVKEDADRQTVETGEIEGAPTIRLVNSLITNAIRSESSDIHLEPTEAGLSVRYRIDGVLHEQPGAPKQLQNSVTSRIKIMSKMNIAEHRLPQDGRMKVKVDNKQYDLRVSVIPVMYGERVVLRVLDSGQGSKLCQDLNSIGMEEEQLEIYRKGIKSPYGIILVTGPTGSGKSTTLYSTLTVLNNREVNILTVEDPVEFSLDRIGQVQAKPEIGLNFSMGLRSFLRQDPDIIMVGEIRDAETAEIAINAALTGHLVFSTLHTNDAAGSVTRLMNMGIEPYLISSTIVMVVAQRLLRLVCPNCKIAHEEPIEHILKLGFTADQFPGRDKVTLYKGTGCDKCFKGYKGRTGCYEVMEINNSIREMILSRAPTHEIKKAALNNGMITMREGALVKLFKGLTTIEEVIRVTSTAEDE